MSADVVEEWNAQAERFDEQADHGLLQPEVRSAWQRLLSQELPAGASVLDLGCGTGTLSVLLAEHGHEVTGLDLARRMVERARAKAIRHGVSVEFHIADASNPPVLPTFDVVLVRHVLWALPDPSLALDRWLTLIGAGGRLLLIEGLWGTGAGLSAAAVSDLVRPKVRSLTVRHLTDPAYWGRSVDDERFLIVAST